MPIFFGFLRETLKVQGVFRVRSPYKSEKPSGRQTGQTAPFIRRRWLLAVICPSEKWDKSDKLQGLKNTLHRKIKHTEDLKTQS